MTEPSPLDLTLLRSFSPLDGLKGENLRALARKTTIREMGQGRLLFKEGDSDKRTFYLVSGTVGLLTGGHVVGTVNIDNRGLSGIGSPGRQRPENDECKKEWAIDHGISPQD